MRIDMRTGKVTGRPEQENAPAKAAPVSGGGVRQGSGMRIDMKTGTVKRNKAPADLSGGSKKLTANVTQPLGLNLPVLPTYEAAKATGVMQGRPGTDNAKPAQPVITTTGSPTLDGFSPKPIQRAQTPDLSELFDQTRGGQRGSEEVNFELENVKQHSRPVLEEIMLRGAPGMAQDRASADEILKLAAQYGKYQPRLKALNEELDEAQQREHQQMLDAGYRDANFGDLTGLSAERGYYNARYGQEMFNRMMGLPDEADRYREILESDRYKYIPNGWGQEAISGAASLLGQQARQITDPETLALMTSGVGIAALSGQAPGLNVLPEEIITVPGAIAAAIQAGSTKQNFEIEAGLAYDEMVQNGISHETAKKIALGVGTVNSALEFVQTDQLLKAFRSLAKKGATKSTAQKIGEELLRRGVDIAGETAQEVAQEGSTIAGAQLASKLETGEWAYDRDEVRDRLADTAKSSALSFGGLNAVSAGKNLFTGRRTATAQNTLEPGGGVAVMERPQSSLTENSTAQEVYSAATQTQQNLDTLLSDVAQQLDIPFEPATQKSLESMENKVARKRAQGEDYSLLSMKDHARGKLELSDFNQIPEVLRILDEKKIPYSAEAIRPTEWGCRGFHITFRDGQGLSSEIQLTRPDVWKVKLESDAIYEKWRNITDLDTLNQQQRTERAADLKRSQDMWDQLNLPDFISFSTSSGDSDLALNSSSDETGRSGLDQRPLKNSNISPPLYHSDNSIKRPDSVRNAIVTPPAVDNNSIPQQGEIFYTPQNSGSWTETGTQRAWDDSVAPAGDAGYNEISNGGSATDSEGQPLSDGQARRLADTAVRDGDGRPLAVYHFTPEMDFETFAKGDTGFHFGTLEQAQQRGRDLNAEQGRLFRACLDIRNPIRFRLDIGSWWASQAGLYLWSEGYLTDAEWAELSKLENNGFNSKGSKRLRDILLEKGYDGFVYPNGIEGEGDSFVVFDDSQIIKMDITKTKPNGQNGGSADSGQGKMDYNRTRGWRESANSREKMADGESGGGVPPAGSAQAGVGVHTRGGGQNLHSDDRGGRGVGDTGAKDGGDSPSGSFGANTVGAAESNPDSYSALANRHGTIPEGEAPRARVVDAPKKSADGRLVSRFARTMMEAGVTPDMAVSEFERQVAQGAMSHEVVTDKKALGYAQRVMREEGFDGALKLWESIVEGTAPAGKNQIALGQTLYNAAVNAKQTALAMKLAAELSVEATRSAQSLQALRLLKKMTPDGQLYYLERSVQKINRDLLDQFGEKYPKLDIPEELAAGLLQAKDQHEADVFLEAIQQSIADRIPASWTDKLNAWRYLSMLGNPRTHMRNILGNMIFVPMRKFKDIIGTGLERTGLVKKEDRTKALPGLSKADRARRDFAQQDFQENAGAVRGENRYDVGTGIRDRRRIFETGVLEKARKLNFAALEAEDAFFLRGAYVSAFAQAMKARGLTAADLTAGTRKSEQTLSEIRAWATNEAQKATYRDANALAGMISRGKAKLGEKARGARTPVGKIAWGTANVAAEGLVPFAKTPANIIKRGLEYSPAGLGAGIIELAWGVKQGKVTAAQAVDLMASGLSGTAVMGLGYFLASCGILTGAGSDERRKRQFDEAQGIQQYALNLFGHSYTIDWAAPTALPLFIGAECHEEFSKDGMSFIEFIRALTHVTDPMFELTMLQGFNSTIKSAMYNENNVFSAVGGNMLQSYVGQYIPTLLGQTARTFDRYRRKVYVDQNRETLFQRFGQKQMAKIPGLSQKLLPMTDVWGRRVGKESLALRAFENFLSPGYLEKVNVTDVDKEINRLFEETGDLSVLPSYPKSSFTMDKKTRYFTAEEFGEFSELRGQTAFQEIGKLIRSVDYRILEDEDRAKAVKALYDYATAYAKSETTEYELKGTDEKIYMASRKGISPGKYVAIHLRDVASQEKMADVLRVTPGLTDEQRAYLWALQNRKWKPKNNPFIRGYRIEGYTEG